MKVSMDAMKQSSLPFVIYWTLKIMSEVLPGWAPRMLMEFVGNKSTAVVRYIYNRFDTLTDDEALEKKEREWLSESKSDTTEIHTRRYTNRYEGRKKLKRERDRERPLSHSIRFSLWFCSSDRFYIWQTMSFLLTRNTFMLIYLQQRSWAFAISICRG